MSFDACDRCGMPGNNWVEHHEMRSEKGLLCDKCEGDIWSGLVKATIEQFQDRDNIHPKVRAGADGCYNCGEAADCQIKDERMPDKKTVLCQKCWNSLLADMRKNIITHLRNSPHRIRRRNREDSLRSHYTGQQGNPFAGRGM